MRPLKRARRPAPPDARAARVDLRPRRTHAVDIFRTTPADTVCPNFYVLAHANGCGFSPQCSYCYLKSSFPNMRAPRAFTNVAALRREVAAWVDSDGLESYVLNTGNLSDSLSLEGARPLVRELIEVFRPAAERGRPHTLLLVTKGGVAECRPLREIEPCANVVVSFSVNVPAAARRHESGAATVESRLAAARSLAAAGWRVRIRVDPMIVGYEYRPLARRVRLLAPERVTLGTLRAEASLIRRMPAGIFAALRPPKAGLGLWRYSLAERRALYRQVIAELDGAVPVGLCEETRATWDALGLDADVNCCNCGA